MLRNMNAGVRRPSPQVGTGPAARLAAVEQAEEIVGTRASIWDENIILCYSLLEGPLRPMTYFKPMEAVCRHCREDKRRRLYRVRHNVGSSRNRVTIFCDHAKPHFTPRGAINEHVTGLLEQVRRRPTLPVPCVQCGRVIHTQGWDPPEDPQSDTLDMLGTLLPLRHPIPKNFVCSKKCFMALLAAQARDRRDARPEVKCGHCGTVFTARRGAKFCSTRCRVAAHRARSVAP